MLSARCLNMLCQWNLCCVGATQQMFISVFVWVTYFVCLETQQTSTVHCTTQCNCHKPTAKGILWSILSCVLNVAELSRGESLWPLVAWLLIGPSTSDWPMGTEHSSIALKSGNQKELQLEREHWRSKTSKNFCWKPHVVSRLAITTVKSPKTLHNNISNSH